MTIRKKKWIGSLSVAIVALTLTGTASARSYTEQEVKRQFASLPVLVAIARCESGMRHFDDDGRVLTNPDSSATGVMQIMSSVHRRPARRLGFDIFTLEGNLSYAKHLYKIEGTKPWKSSRSCWGR